MDTCNGSPSGELLKAFGEFNRGDWFECHETLEELWVGSDGEIRDFFQGSLQIAVALHHWRNGNYKGSILLLESGADYLRRVGPVCQRVDVGHLLVSADRFREALQDLGQARMTELDPDMVPRMRLLSARDSPGVVLRMVHIVVIASLFHVACAQADGKVEKEANEIGQHIKQMGKKTGLVIKGGARMMAVNSRLSERKPAEKPGKPAGLWGIGSRGERRAYPMFLSGWEGATGNNIPDTSG